MKKILSLGVFCGVIIVMSIFIRGTTVQAGESFDYYKKVKIKTSGFYSLKNNAKSSKKQTNVKIRYKRKKGKEVYEGSIKKGKKATLYLTKGTYYIHQYVLNYEYKWMFNKNFKFKKITKNNIHPSGLKENVFTEFYGNINSGVYAKLTAPKTGTIFLETEWLPTGSLYYTCATLCDSNKKLITSTNYYDTGSFDSDLAYRTGQPDETLPFLVEAGKTYYLYFKGNKHCFKAKYKYSQIFDDVNNGGSTKESAAAVVEDQYHIIGNAGAETQWYVYQNTTTYTSSPVFNLFYEKCGWRSNDGFRAEVYDQSGNFVVSGVTSDSDHITLLEDSDYKLAPGEKMYIKVTIDGVKPTAFRLSRF